MADQLSLPVRHVPHHVVIVALTHQGLSPHHNIIRPDHLQQIQSRALVQHQTPGDDDPPESQVQAGGDEGEEDVSVPGPSQ